MRFLRHPLLATVSAAVLALRVLAPDAGHRCAAMEATAAVGAAVEIGVDAAADHAGHAEHAAHAEHAMHGGSAPAGDHDVSHPAGPDTSHECDCDTSCCCVATAATRSDAPAQPTLHIAVLREARVLRATDRPQIRVAHVLPYNTPPPGASLS